MPDKKEIKDNISAIWKISILAKKCLKYSFYLHKPDTEAELDFLNYSRDFHFIRHILWRNSVIELSKLFNSSPKRDKYNIFHFLNKLKKDQYFGGFDINQAKIESWEKRLEESNETINSLLLLRDKVYGHTDNESAKSNLDTPTFEQTEKLLLIVENVIQEIYSTVFDSHAEIESAHIFENPSRIVKILASEKKARIDGLNTLMKK